MNKSLSSGLKTELNTGSYQIFLSLDKTVSIKIGALGLLSFKPGQYVYTGSAMSNLAQRVARHKRRRKFKKWHIDYLTSNRNFKIVKTEVFLSEHREECQRNSLLINEKNAEIPFKGFGSSDCKSCPAHLVYFADSII